MTKVGTAAPDGWQSQSGVSRRTLVKGTAWATPVVTVAMATPAMAASPSVVSGVVCRITRFNDPSHFNTIGQHVYFGWSGDPGAIIPTGTTTTFTIRIEQTVSSGANPGVPNLAYGNYFTGSLSAATSVTPSAGYATAYEYTYTITSTQEIELDATGRACGPNLTWDADNPVRPTTYQTGTSTNVYNNTVFTVSSPGSAPSATYSSLAWNVGGTNGGTNDNYWRPLSIVSTTGYSSLPGIGFTTGVNTSAANYCTSNNPSTWASTCYRCVQNSFPDLCVLTCSTNSSCTPQNCTGSNCR